MFRSLVPSQYAACEEEDTLGFFQDRSQSIIQDDTFARLLTFPNVLITAHPGFFTEEGTAGIASTTIANLTAFERDGAPSTRWPRSRSDRAVRPGRAQPLTAPDMKPRT